MAKECSNKRGGGERINHYFLYSLLPPVLSNITNTTASKKANNT
ncbi:hypothetical protein ECHHL_0045 [Ehrlichia chaffeensis str. Heartland]|nr:hypothetical protein ECHHL_0045 [Ehrlichia chaffeensis str. Heartland]